MTALHYHECSDNVAVLSFLLASGAAVDAMDYRGATALHWAIFQRFGYTALVLLAGGGESFRPGHDRTIASHVGRFEARGGVNKIINDVGRRGSSREGCEWGHCHDVGQGNYLEA